MISNSTKKYSPINWLLFIEMLCCTLMIWFNCSLQYDKASHAFTISFIVLLGYFIKFFAEKFQGINNTDILLFVIIIISLLNVLFSIFLAGRTLSFNTLKSYFIFLATNIYFRLAATIKTNKKTTNWIFLFAMIISMIYIYCKRAYPQQISEYGFNGLTLNFSNPNFTGMFLFLTLLYTFLGIFYFKNFILKILCIFLSCSNFSMLLQTESRNPVLAFVLFLGIFILNLFKEKVCFSKAFNFIVNVAPTAFMILYLNFISKIIEKGWLDFWVSEGKNLNSRVRIWTSFLRRLGNMWLTGDYAKLVGNSHNSHLVLLCSFGVIVLILTICLTYKITCEISQKNPNKFQTNCLTAFYATIFMGFGEGALYAGGLGIYILAGTFLALANSVDDSLNE